MASEFSEQADKLFRPLRELTGPFTPHLVVELLREQNVKDEPHAHLIADMIEGMADRIAELEWIRSQLEK